MATLVSRAGNSQRSFVEFEMRRSTLQHVGEAGKEKGEVPFSVGPRDEAVETVVKRRQNDGRTNK